MVSTASLSVARTCGYRVLALSTKSSSACGSNTSMPTALSNSVVSQSTRSMTSFFPGVFGQSTTTDPTTTTTASTASNVASSLSDPSVTAATASPSFATASLSSTKETPSDTIVKRRDIIQEIADTHELSYAKSERIFATVMDTIMDSLADNKTTVQISKFGTFETYTSKARTGRNPNTGETIEIPSKQRIRFKPMKHFKDLVQG